MNKLIGAVLIGALPLVTGCSKLLKPLTDSGHTVPAAAPKMTRDIVIVAWGQSNATDTYLWPKLGSLITTGRVTVYNYAVSATDSAFWANPANHQALVTAVAQYQPDYVFCIQGEGDGGTSDQDYFQRMYSVWEKIKQAAPGAYRSLALCTYNSAQPKGGQRMLVGAGIVNQGPDADVYRTATLSRDSGLHFNKAGNDAIAMEWAQIILRR